MSGTLVGGLAVLAAAHRESLVLVVVTAVLLAGCALAAGLAATRTRSPDDALPASPWMRLVATATVSLLVAAVGVLLALTA
jgi:hypothetical protein